MSTRDARAGPRRERDTGAALIEAAVAVPLLLLFLLGFAELAGTMRAHAAVESAVRAAGRTASVAGADPLADRSILTRLAAEAAPLGADTIDYIVVWHASGPGESVPASCRPEATSAPNVSSLGVSDGGVDAVGACNVYVRPGAPGGAFDRLDVPLAEVPFGCSGTDDPDAEDKLDCSWPSHRRRVVHTPRTVLGPAIPTDFIGVHVQLRHDHIVRLIGSSSTLTGSSINLIEPRGYEV
jgi:hypothetical protein